MFSDVMEATMKQPSVKFVILTGTSPVFVKKRSKSKGSRIIPSFCLNKNSRETGEVSRQCLVGSLTGAVALRRCYVTTAWGLSKAISICKFSCMLEPPFLK